MARQFNQSSNAYANALRIEQTLQQSLSLLPDDTKSENSDSNYLQDPFADDIEPIDSKTVPKPSNKAVSKYLCLKMCMSKAWLTILL